MFPFCCPKVADVAMDKLCVAHLVLDVECDVPVRRRAALVQSGLAARPPPHAALHSRPRAQPAQRHALPAQVFADADSVLATHHALAAHQQKSNAFWDRARYRYTIPSLLQSSGMVVMDNESVGCFRVHRERNDEAYKQTVELRGEGSAGHARHTLPLPSGLHFHKFRFAFHCSHCIYVVSIKEYPLVYKYTI